MAAMFGQFNWENESGQSADIILYSGNLGSNAVTLGSSIGYKLYECTGFETYSDAYLARSYGDYFLSLPLCLDEGGTTSNATTLWSQASDVYTALKSHLSNANYIKNISYNPSATDSISKALVRYDTLLHKRGTTDFTNFIGRGLVTQLVGSINPEQSGFEFDAILIISFATLIALSSVVVIIVIKKKRLH